MNQKAILFDLDGTLTDSGEGITKCANLALNHFGIHVDNMDELRVFVGPPLRKAFLSFGIAPDNIEEAITVFRSRYTTVGKFENFPYPGIRELLKALKNQGHRLFVATSKPEVTAIQILDKFELSQYFEEICGALMAEQRDSKEEVIQYLFDKTGTVSKAIMVGDTKYDVIGASAHHIPTIGVSWGYGSVKEMIDAGASAIAHTPQELQKLIEEM